jgi:type IV pilus assembly protein PilQ
MIQAPSAPVRRCPRSARRAAAMIAASTWSIVAGAPLALCAEPVTGSAQVIDAADADGGDEQTHVRVTDRGTVEMHVSNLPLADVLRLLSLESRRNIIASPMVSGTVTASLYGVSFEEALQAILVANGAGYRVEGKFIYVYTNDELAKMAEASNPPITKVIRLNYIPAADAAEYVTPLLGENGHVSVSTAPATGIASSPDEAGGFALALPDFLIVTARPEVLELIERVIREVDVRPQQILVEATILRAQLTDDNALGLDFTLLGGVDLELLGATSQAISDLSLGQLPIERFELFNASAATDFRANVPPGGLSIGIIKDHVAVFLRALESVTETTVLANPKILALNKQRGQVIVGRRDGYLTTTVTELQAIQTVEFLETGTQLIFRPFITEDGVIRVELHPEDSVGFVNAQGLPTEQTTEVTTNVLVKDGHTILIGGLFREVSTDAREQIPILGNIPGLGQLFRSNNDSSAREEIIILLTVRIVKDDDRYSKYSAEMEEDIERIRVGVRSGMMWHSRERLAQQHYQNAVQHLAGGRRDKALWDINMAVHNNPLLLPATRLRERLTSERAWEQEGSAVRGFLQRLLRDESNVYDEGRFGRPIPRVDETAPLNIVPNADAPADGDAAGMPEERTDPAGTEPPADSGDATSRPDEHPQPAGSPDGADAP